MAANEFIFQLAESDSDLKGAYQVRQQVFITEQGIPAELVFDSGDSCATHFIIRDGHHVIGTARISFPKPEQAKLERMAILKLLSEERSGTNNGTVLVMVRSPEDLRHFLSTTQ